eukprot:1181484-Prorocentrum_minimum.AAC.3
MFMPLPPLLARAEQLAEEPSACGRAVRGWRQRDGGDTGEFAILLDAVKARALPFDVLFIYQLDLSGSALQDSYSQSVAACNKKTGRLPL